MTHQTRPPGLVRTLFRSFLRDDFTAAAQRQAELERDLDQVRRLLAVRDAELHRARQALAAEEVAPETRHALVRLGLLFPLAVLVFFGDSVWGEQNSTVQVSLVGAMSVLAGVVSLIPRIATVRAEMTDLTFRERLRLIRSRLSTVDLLLAVVTTLAFGLGAWGVESTPNLLGLVLTVVALVIVAVVPRR